MLNTLTLHIGKERTTLSGDVAGLSAESSVKRSIESSIELPIGYADIAARYYKHTPPSYDDVEYAINTLEDEIEKIVSRVPQSDVVFVSQDDFVRELAELCGVANAAQRVIPRDTLEQLFGGFAEVSMGRPPSLQEQGRSNHFYA